MSTVHTTAPVPPIKLEPAGTRTTVERIAAGAPVELVWPGEDTPLRAFLAKAIRWTYEPDVTVGELYNLIYGAQNPILVDGVVTRAATEDPAWGLLMEAIDRKRAAVGHLDVEAARARFTMPVSEAALQLGVSTSAVRQLIDRSRLVACKEGASYLLDPASVAAYRGVRRGPSPAASLLERQPAAAPSVERGAGGPVVAERVSVRIGHDAQSGAHVRIKGARIADPVTDNGFGSRILTGELAPGWTRLYVLAYRKKSARLFVFEPDPGRYNECRFDGLFLTGPMREVERDNTSTRARSRFESLPKD